MSKIIVKILISALAVFSVSYILSGIHVTSFVTALYVAFVVGLLNLIVRPILFILTLPITLLTLGLFTFVLNGIIIYFASILVPGFYVSNFWWAVLGAFLISILKTAFEHVFIKE
jgi:putative membrane protein